MKSINNHDIDFVRDAKLAVKGQRINGANFLLFGMIATFAIIVGWSAFAYLDEITKGHGKVIPSSSVQTIQNLEGGILAELSVREGQAVKKGDILARIDDTQSAATYRENLVQRDALEAVRARHLAESKGQALVSFSQRIKDERPDLVESETRLFNQRREDLQKRENVLARSLELASDELGLLRPMVERKVAPKVDMLRLEREVNELKGQIEELRNEYRNGALEAYNEANTKWESTTELVEGHQDRLTRTTVRSPVNGTINKIHIKSVGGVIQPGESIMDLVPVDDTLLVEAKIKPSDIGFLKPGNQAKIKFTAYDFSMYGSLNGVVEHISADTILDEVDGEHYYQIKVRNSEGKLMKEGKELDILPGMIAEVDVITGRRTVLQYLSKPLHRTVINSMTER